MARRADRRDALKPTFVGALVEMVRDEVAETSQRQFAARVLITHTTISRMLSGKTVPSNEVIDALVEYFRPYRVMREYMRQVRLARERALLK